MEEPNRLQSEAAVPRDSEKLKLLPATSKIARFHIYDWIALCGLIMLYGALNLIDPFYRFVGETMIGDYMYPLKSNTIPFQVVPIIAGIIPILIFVGYFLYKKDITDLHHAILGLIFAIVITGIITDTIKLAVGRPRPNFFWRCFPDGHAVFSNDTGDVLCNGDEAVIKEGHKSFPSGHTSWSFAGMAYLSLYLAGKLQLFNGQAHVSRVIIVLAPLMIALLVGLSRIDDYWHHWQDVFAGALIGSVMAAVCYHHFFPSTFHAKGSKPYNHLKVETDFDLPFFGRRRASETRNDRRTIEMRPAKDEENNMPLA